MDQVVLSHFDPPFRAEHIGSLLRPAHLLDVRSRFGRGEVDRDALIAAEDRAIKEALALQERVGLKLATDGEFRRRSYHSFFYSQLARLRAARACQFARAPRTPRHPSRCRSMLGAKSGTRKATKSRSGKLVCVLAF